MNAAEIDAQIIEPVVTEVLESTLFLAAEPDGAFDWDDGSLRWSTIDLHRPALGALVLATSAAEAEAIFTMLWAGERLADDLAVAGMIDELANAIAGQTLAQLDPQQSPGLGLPDAGRGPLPPAAAERRYGFRLEDGKRIGVALRALV
ncbi:MAG: hypothetical protein RL071_2252 [Pseudomonadota bacterium]|jgi:hypothetical protein